MPPFGELPKVRLECPSCGKIFERAQSAKNATASLTDPLPTHQNPKTGVQCQGSGLGGIPRGYT